MAVVTARDHYLSLFEALERQGAFADPSWLASLRRQGLEHFAGRGFPTTRDEDWRYTSVAPLAAAAFRPAAPSPDGVPAAALARVAVPDADWPRLVFVDGRHAERLSSVPWAPEDGRADSLGRAIASDDELVERHLGRHAAWDRNVFAALSTAFVQDGAFVAVPAEAEDRVIELLFLAATPDVVAHPRNLVVVGPHSRITVIERYVGLTAGPYFTNAVTEIALGPGAVVDHYVVQDQAPQAFHVATLHAALEQDAAFTTCGVVLGARLARTTLAVAFSGPGGRADVNGLYVVGDRQHVDHHVTVDHAVPRCASRQLFKGVLDDAARAVFNGRILVRPGAQKTDAMQTNKHLLLSEGVEVDSKPQLEIFADDVRCTHGAAEGQLAPEALFYLKSRGIGDATARALLTYGFAREVLERVSLGTLAAYLDNRLMARLQQAPGSKETR